jgi:anion-transporting  ArsA/GET3 family ATPase
MDGLFAHSLPVVTGKGGVGKSTVAAALGLAADRRGLRTIVVEVAARDDLSHALGATDTADTVRRTSGL